MAKSRSYVRVHHLTRDASNRMIYVVVTSLGAMHMFMHKLHKQRY